MFLRKQKQNWSTLILYSFIEEAYGLGLFIIIGRNSAVQNPERTSQFSCYSECHSEHIYSMSYGESENI